MRNCFTQNVQGTECPFLFIVHELHKELCFLARIEIGENTAFYDPESSGCHSLLRRYDIVAQALYELIHELSSAGTSCCVGALITLSSVLRVPISSYYPQISSSFIAPVTVYIVGRGVNNNRRRIAVMWSTVGETININHVVPMINTPYQESPFHAEIICRSMNNDNGMSFGRLLESFVVFCPIFASLEYINRCLARDGTERNVNKAV